MISETIVAIATPPGRGGLGILRLSGPGVLAIANGLFESAEILQPRHATLVRLALPGRGTIDHAIATYFPSPHSYTGEDVVELSVHGSPVLLREVLEAALAAGARLADRGEFTLRAFLNGKIDLVQAEAVGDLIAASTPLQARAAFDQLDGTLTSRIKEIDATLLDLIVRLEASLDFPEEGYRFVESGEAVNWIGQIEAMLDTLVRDGRRGRLIREGLRVAIVGRPNVGKSSVFNRLAGADRAIVHHTAGTTRDLVSEIVDIHGLAVTLIDTAGLRESHDAVEAEGVRRAEQSALAADLVLVVLDGSAPLTPEDRAVLDRTGSSPRIVVVNKIDRSRAWETDHLPREAPNVAVSAIADIGFDALRSGIASEAGVVEGAEPALVTNMRHVRLLERARTALDRARDGAAAGAYEELVLADLHEARCALEEVTGTRSADDLLTEIFGRFCIGK